MGKAMSNEIMHPIVPVPRVSLNIRPATIADIPFIDALQNMHHDMVGWMPGKSLEGKLAAGHVIIAEGERRELLGYCISHDQYLKRDDLGVIYQLNVAPLHQRQLVGAALVKATFEKAAYGCRLFCCWCAQDLRANWFWESIGFIPLAFRTGTGSRQRTHIFWQRRIREDDTSTPFWFPFHTGAGVMREDRLVFPIPPGTHWRDAQPVVLPNMPVAPVRLPVKREKPKGEPISGSRKAAIARSQSKHLKGTPPGKAAVLTAGGIRYIERGDYVPEPAPVKVKRPPKPRVKNNPAHVAAAREVRDRYLEQFNSGMVLPNGKYEVARALPALVPVEALRLPQAA